MLPVLQRGTIHQGLPTGKMPDTPYPHPPPSSYLCHLYFNKRHYIKVRYQTPPTPAQLQSVLPVLQRGTIHQGLPTGEVPGTPYPLPPPSAQLQSVSPVLQQGTLHQGLPAGMMPGILTPTPYPHPPSSLSSLRLQQTVENVHFRIVLHYGKSPDFGHEYVRVQSDAGENRCKWK